MAKNKVNIDVKVDDKGSTKKLGLESKKAAKGLDDTAKGARNADRNLKGAAQASSNTTKNFSKMAQGTGGLVAAYATLAAQIFAVTAAFGFLKRAGDLAVLQAGQKAYAGATGSAMRTLANDIIAATDAQVTFQDASQAAAIGVAAGLSPQQLTDLGKAAKDASAILGRDVTDSFNRLVRGVTKAEPELLDELGIILRLKDASEEYARALGKDASALTTFEKSQAVANNVLTQAEEKYGRILAITGIQTNKYAKLSKAFDDIINKIKLIAERAAGPLAKLLTDFPELVGLAVAGFLGPVLRAAIPGLANLGAAAQAAADRSGAAFQKAKADLDAYNRALAAAGADPKARAALGKSARTSLVSGLEGVESGSGTVLGKLRAGDQLSNQQLGALKRQLKKRNGVFKNFNKKQAVAMIRHLDDLMLANSSATKKMAADYNKMEKSASAAFLRLKAKGLSAMDTLARGASVAGAFISRAFSFLGYVGMLVSIGMLIKGFFSQKEATEELASSTDILGDKLKSVNEDLEHFVAIQKEINREGSATASVIMSVGRALQNIPSLDEVAFEAAFVSSEILPEIAKVEDELKGLEGLLATYRHPISGTATHLDPYGILAREVDKEIASTKATLEALRDPKQTEALDNFLEILQKQADVLLMRSDMLLRNSNEGQAFLEMNRKLQNGERVTQNEIHDTITAYINLGKVVDERTRLNTENAKTATDLRQKMFPKSEIEIYIESLKKQLELEGSIVASNALAAEEQQKKITGLETEIDLMKELRDQKIRHAQETAQLEFTQLAGSPMSGDFPMLKKRREEMEKIERMQLNITQMEESLALNKRVAFGEDGKSSPTVAQLAEMEKINLEIEKQTELVRRANHNLSDGAKIANSMAATLESSMTTAFQGLITGTMTVKQAFASMAQSILQQLARIIAEMLTMRVLAAMFAPTIGGNSAVNSAGMPVHSGAPNAGANAAVRGFGGPNYSLTGLPSNRYGGVMGPNGKKMTGYSVGGIAKGPNAGYPVMMHGTEAIVPLPNGKSIPVEMKGSGASQINQITVNVSSDGQTTTEGGKGMDMEKLGTAVAAAVQKELQNQKRSGGMLNPYGVA